MADNYTILSDTLSSREGKVFITINGQNRELFEVRNCRAQLDLTVIERMMRGKRMMQHKVVGAKGTGTATLYFMNSELLNQTIHYIKTGEFARNKLQMINADAQSTVGKQDITLSDVIFKSIPVAAVEDSDDPIEFDSDFTYDDIDSLESFQLPANYR